MKSRCQQLGHAPSKGSGGESFLLLLVAGGCNSLAWGYSPPIPASVFRWPSPCASYPLLSKDTSLDLEATWIIQDDLESLNYIRKHPLPK